MALPDVYLRYPMRRAGPDHARYDADPFPDRSPLNLPGGADVGLWVTVALEFFPLNTPAAPFKAPGGMMTPYPDLRHFTSRDYGNRVGVYRLLDLFDRLGLRASFAVNAAVAERCAPLVADLKSAGHEIIAHGIDMAALHHSGLDEAQERDQIRAALDALEAAFGERPKGWLSPARSQSWTTPDLLAEEGVAWCLDWPNDDLPYAFRTRAGGLIALPLTNELDDWKMHMVLKRSEEEFSMQILDALATHRRDAQTGGGQILSLSLRPYLSGLPYRVGPMGETLARALDEGSVPVTGGDLADAFEASA